ncbi:hypothetical protein O0L34_g15232 [Tuta absoluta]|nr:hypothetical protein O0L34_g15232 [Tuta absoluta]
MRVKIFLLALLVALSSAGKHDVYKGYTVYGIVTSEGSDLELLHQLEEPLDLDVLQHGDAQRETLVMVAPENNAKFLEKLDEYGIQVYVKVADVPKYFEEFDADYARYRSSRTSREAIPFDNYPRYAEVNEYLERIAAQYPDIVTLVNMGPSYEGRDIKYLKISTTNFTDTSKPIYFMDALIHAREWVTAPVALYSIHRLVEDLRAEDQDLLEGTDWIIMPMVNPDGYEWSHDQERMWRRTRRVDPTVNTTCVGVDANRNFDVAFNTVGVSANPCEQTYPGSAPFSEPETRYVRDILFEHLDRIQLYVNIHSHGNWVLFGFGNRTMPANGVALHHVGAILGSTIDAVKLPQAPFYRVGNSANLLYPSSGSAQDYAQDIGVPFSYTLELPGLGYAFQVPPSYIAKINEETWRGIAQQARLSKMHYNMRIGS